MKSLSNWRDVRIFEAAVQSQLQRDYSLRWHGLLLGSLTLAATWLTSHLLMLFGDAASSLALRYLISLGMGYLVYLALLRLWAAALLRRDDATYDGSAPDLTDLRFPSKGQADPTISSGGGGDFAGGGASADFSAPAEAGDILGDAASGALEAAGSADEAAVVVIPVVAVFFIGAAILFGAGSLVMAYLGWEVLLTVAVELAFAYAGARTAVRVTREGWLPAAVRLTYKPMLATVLCATALGFAIDHFVPQAQSLPQAIKLLRT
jgi:hypothetical protein